jgi:hypothetical protein
MKRHSFLLFVIILLFSACKKEPIIDEEPVSLKSYILIDGSYYSLKNGYVSFDEAGGRYTSTIWLTDAADNSGFTIDFLMVNDTTALPDGNYEYKKVSSVKDMEAGKFHTLAIQYRTGGITKQISSFNTEIAKANIEVKRHAGLDITDALVEFEGKVVKIHFEGKFEYLKYW